MLIDSTTSSLDGSMASMEHHGDNGTDALVDINENNNSNDDDGYSIISRTTEMNENNNNSDDDDEITDIIVETLLSNSNVDGSSIISLPSSSPNCLNASDGIPLQDNDVSDTVENFDDIIDIEHINQSDCDPMEIVHVEKSDLNTNEGNDVTDVSKSLLTVETNANGTISTSKYEHKKDGDTKNDYIIFLHKNAGRFFIPLLLVLLMSLHYDSLLVQERNSNNNRHVKEYNEMQKHIVVMTTLMSQRDDQISQLYDRIQELQDESLVVEENHQTEIHQLRKQLGDAQDTILSLQQRHDQQDVVPQLQEQVHQLIEEAVAVEIATRRETRRLEKEIRDITNQSNHVVSQFNLCMQMYDETLDKSEKCLDHKRQLKMEIKKLKSERNKVKAKLHETSHQLKESNVEIKRQNKMIIKLQKKLANFEAKRKQSNESRTKKRDQTNKSNDSSSTSSDKEYNTFQWESKTKYDNDDTILIDNCWLYLQTKMELGECVWETTDHIKDHFQWIMNQILKQ